MSECNCNIGPYIAVSNIGKIDPLEKLMLYCMAYFMDSEYRAEVRPHALAKESGLSVREVINILDSLVDQRIISHSNVDFRCVYTLTLVNEEC